MALLCIASASNGLITDINMIGLIVTMKTNAAFEYENKKKIPKSQQWTGAMILIMHRNSSTLTHFTSIHLNRIQIHLIRIQIHN